MYIYTIMPKHNPVKTSIEETPVDNLIDSPYDFLNKRLCLQEEFLQRVFHEEWPIFQEYKAIQKTLMDIPSHTDTWKILFQRQQDLEFKVFSCLTRKISTE